MSGLREIGQGAARVLLSVPEASFSFSAQQWLPLPLRLRIERARTCSCIASRNGFSTLFSRRES